MKDKEPENDKREWRDWIHDQTYKASKVGASIIIDGDLMRLNKEFYEEFFRQNKIERIESPSELREFLQANYTDHEVSVELDMDSKAAITKPDEVHVGTSTQAAESTAPVVLPPQPPLDAEFILHLLLNKDEQDALIGDLIERYGRKCERLGVRRANLWFYAEVVRTAWPLVKRVIAKAGGALAVGEWLRRHIS